MDEQQQNGGGLDLTGLGKAMQAVPESAWAQLVDTACSTFKALVAPITSTSAGAGRFIQAKFDRLVDTEKVLVAGALERATEKAKAKGGELRPPRIRIAQAAIDATAVESDQAMRELWSNLLAQEMLNNSVHPEVCHILSRLGPQDARLLAELAQEGARGFLKAFSTAILRFGRQTALGVPLTTFNVVFPPESFSHDHLGRLGLITNEGDNWALTSLGRGFIEAVSDPSDLAAEDEV